MTDLDVFSVVFMEVDFLIMCGTAIDSVLRFLLYLASKSCYLPEALKRRNLRANAKWVSA